MDAIAVARAEGLQVHFTSPSSDFVECEPFQSTLLQDTQAPWLPSAVASLRAGFPYSPVRASWESDHFFKLPRHLRALYCRPPNGIDGAGVLAIKGTEPLSGDIEDWLAALAHGRCTVTSTQETISEHFCLYEHKIPGALTLREAVHEAQVAFEVQQRHISAYGGIAAHPLPLFIYTIARPLVDRFAISLRKHLSTRAWLRVASQIDEGLAVYVYYYPNLPVRVSHFDGSLDGRANFTERERALAKTWPPLQFALPLWVRTFSRLLALGYLPAALGSRGTGDCCNPDNAVLDGGFVDLDSLIPLAELSSESAVFRTLDYSLRSLTNTCTCLLLGRSSRSRDTKSGSGRRVAELAIRDYLKGAVREALKPERHRGLTIDPRITGYFASQRTLPQLLDFLRATCDAPYGGL